MIMFFVFSLYSIITNKIASISSDKITSDRIAALQGYLVFSLDSKLMTQS